MEESKKQTIYGKMNELWASFTNEHSGTTKTSQQRARKAIGELKKLVTEYRKASVEESR